MAPASHPAAFINNIAEEGTKQEAITYLQRTWDEKCGLQAEFNELQEAARALIADIRARHPGEELRCAHLRAIDKIVNK